MESFWLVIGIEKVKFAHGALVIILKALPDCAKGLLFFRNTQKYFTMEKSKTWSKLAVADDIQTNEQCYSQDSILFLEGCLIVED